VKQGLTELVFILDKSGSMGGLESDTIGGYNAMLEKQKQVQGECVVTTVLFDHGYELLHDRIDLRAVGKMTEKEYQIGGSTALLDAMGTTMNKIRNVQRNTAEEYRAENVMFVIITDGQENSSHEYSVETIRSQVEQHQQQDGWEFIFLGANMDAIETAGHVGIRAGYAQSYHADKQGVELNFAVISDVVTRFREQGEVSEDWKEKIEADYRRRGGEH
jgi:uncharacterized protein YegL